MKVLKLINLTPHDVRIRQVDGTVLDYPACDIANPLRADEKTEVETHLKGTPVRKMSFKATQESCERANRYLQVADGILVSKIMAEALAKCGIHNFVFICGKLDRATGVCDGICVL